MLLRHAPRDSLILRLRLPPGCKFGGKEQRELIGILHHEKTPKTRARRVGDIDAAETSVHRFEEPRGHGLPSRLKRNRMRKIRRLIGRVVLERDGCAGDACRRVEFRFEETRPGTSKGSDRLDLARCPRIARFG